MSVVPSPTRGFVVRRVRSRSGRRLSGLLCTRPGRSPFPIGRLLVRPGTVGLGLFVCARLPFCLRLPRSRRPGRPGLVLVLLATCLARSGLSSRAESSCQLPSWLFAARRVVLSLAFWSLAWWPRGCPVAMLFGGGGGFYGRPLTRQGRLRRRASPTPDPRASAALDQAPTGQAGACPSLARRHHRTSSRVFVLSPWAAGPLTTLLFMLRCRWFASCGRTTCPPLLRLVLLLLGAWVLLRRRGLVGRRTGSRSSTPPSARPGW